MACQEEKNYQRVTAKAAKAANTKPSVCQYKGCGKPIAKAKTYCGDPEEFGTCAYLRRKDTFAELNAKRKETLKTYVCENCDKEYRHFQKKLKGLCGSVKKKRGCAYKLSVAAALEEEKKKKLKYIAEPDYRNETIIYKLQKNHD